MAYNKNAAFKKIEGAFGALLNVERRLAQAIPLVYSLANDGGVEFDEYEAIKNLSEAFQLAIQSRLKIEAVMNVTDQTEVDHQ